MPTATPGLRSRGGLPLVWGRALGAPAAADRLGPLDHDQPARAGDRRAGSGKTYAVSGLIAQELALGQDAILILDPKLQEYRPLVTALGGAYISLSEASGYHINLLELPRSSPERAQAVAGLEEDLLGQRVGVVKALIARELKAMGTRVDAVAVAEIVRGGDRAGVC